MSYSKSYIGDKTDKFAHSARNDAFTGVNITLDNDVEVFVGEEGNVLEVNLPICNSTEDAETYGRYILDSLADYRYQPFEADGAIINPAAQIGDGVTVRSVYSGVYSRDTKIGRLSKATISAPFDEEVDSEYPFKSGERHISYRKYKRLEANMESEFSIQATEISAKVSQLSPAGQTNFSWSLTADGHHWYSNGSEVMSVTSQGLAVKGQITALSGYIGSESQGFTISSSSIRNGKTSLSDANAGVYIGTDGISLGDSTASGNNTDTMFKVDSNGNATIKNLTVLGRMYYKDTQSSSASYRTASGAYGGIGGGIQFNNSQNTATTETDIFMANTTVGRNGGTLGAHASDTPVIKGYGVNWTSITINGATYNVMTHS